MAKKSRRKGPRRHRVEITPREGGGRALEVNGVVQSISVDAAPNPLTHPTPSPSPTGRGVSGREGGTWGEVSKVGARPVSSVSTPASAHDSPPARLGYWELLLPPAGSCPRRALFLGLGGGTIAALLARACPGVAMVGIERDETVLTLARLEFGLDAIPALEIVVADAFAEVALRAEREPASYDFICLDLYEGGRLAPGSLATTFLRQLATLLTPSGLLSVNLIVTGRQGEQLHRLSRVFTTLREQRLHGNLVVHARPRAAPDEE